MGKTVIANINNGMNSAKATLINTTQNIISAILNLIKGRANEFRTVGVQLVNQLNVGFGSGKDSLSQTAQSITNAMLATLRNFNGSFRSIGENFASGIKSGFLSQEDSLKKAVNAMMERIVSSAKAKMDINSPSKVWAEIGDYMAQGLDVGFVGAMKGVTKDINNSLPTSIQGVDSLNQSNNLDSMVSAFKKALSEVKIEMDDEEMGKFVDKVVTRLVYS